MPKKNKKKGPNTYATVFSGLDKIKGSALSSLKTVTSNQDLIDSCFNFEGARDLLNDATLAEKLTDPLSFFTGLANRYAEILHDILMHALFRDAFIKAKVEQLKIINDIPNLHGYSNFVIYIFFVLSMEKCFPSKDDENFIKIIKPTVISLIRKNESIKFLDDLLSILQLIISARFTIEEVDALLAATLCCVKSLEFKDRKVFGVYTIKKICDDLIEYCEDFEFLLNIKKLSLPESLHIRIFYSTYLLKKMREKLALIDEASHFEIDLKLSYFSGLSVSSQYERQYNFKMKPDNIQNIYMGRILAEDIISEIETIQDINFLNIPLYCKVYLKLLSNCFAAGDLEAGFLFIKFSLLQKISDLNRIKIIWFGLVDAGYKINECLEIGQKIENSSENFFNFEDIQHLITFLDEYRNKPAKILNVHKYNKKDKIIKIDYNSFVIIIVDKLSFLYEEQDSGDAGLLLAKCIVDGLFDRIQISEKTTRKHAYLILDKLIECDFKKEICDALKAKIVEVEEANTELNSPAEAANLAQMLAEEKARLEQDLAEVTFALNMLQ